jgi:hypothetical protein
MIECVVERETDADAGRLTPFAIRLLVLVALVGAGCRFDTSGISSARLRPDAPPRLDAAPDANRRTDGSLELDASPPPDLHLDTALPDAPVPVTNSCSAGPQQHIVASAVPVAGAKVNLIVTAAEATWVMAGVAAGPDPSAGDFTWKGEVLPGATCTGGSCTWEVPGVQVPSAPPPYTFGFMKGATGDKWWNGEIVFTCRP